MNSAQIKKCVSIKNILSKFGYYPDSENCGILYYKSPLRIEETPSFKVDENKNVWFDHGTGDGGNIIDLVCKLKNISVLQAIRLINETSFLFSQAKNIADERKSNMNEKCGNIKIIAVKKLTNENLCNYIADRGIHIEIAQKFCNELHYSVNKKKYYTIAFKNDLGGFAHRNKYFKGNIGPSYFTVVKPEKMSNETLFIFEGFIDFLSWLMISKSILAPRSLILNSIVNIEKASEIIKQAASGYTFLDNDNPGNIATAKLLALNSKLVNNNFIYSGYKDLNVYLLEKINLTEKK